MADNFLIKKSGDTFDPEFGIAIVQTVFGEAACQVTDYDLEDTADQKEMMSKRGETRMVLLHNQRYVMNVTLLIEPLVVFGDWDNDPSNTHTTGNLPKLEIGSVIIIPGLGLKGSIMPPVKVKMTPDGWLEVNLQATRWASIGDPVVSAL